MYTRLPHPMSRPASGCSHPVHQTAAFSDRRAAAQRQAALIGAIRKSTPEQTVPSGPPVQRLVLKYGGGGMDSIDKDSDEIARRQDASRRSRQDIPVQDLFHIDDSVYALMDDKEAIYIVSHGRAAIGSFPAVLEQMAGRSKEEESPADGKIRTTGEKERFNIDGARIAEILKMIRIKLKAIDKNKEIGPVKIEACMSAMRRTTPKKKLFGSYKFTEHTSLIDDIKHRLPMRFPAVLRGNTGFSTITDFSHGRVQVTDKMHTELGLLCNMLELLLRPEMLMDARGEKRQALFLDARNTAETYKEGLAAFDLDFNEKHSGMEINSYQEICQFLDSGGREGNRSILRLILPLLSTYIRKSVELPDVPPEEMPPILDVPPEETPPLPDEESADSSSSSI